jgi:hypothetical protein
MMQSYMTWQWSFPVTWRQGMTFHKYELGYASWNNSFHCERSNTINFGTYIYIYIYMRARACMVFFLFFFWKRKDVTRTIVNFKFGTRQIFGRCKINGKEELGPNMSRNGNNAMLLSFFYFNYIFESLN